MVFDQIIIGATHAGCDFACRARRGASRVALVDVRNPALPARLDLRDLTESYLRDSCLDWPGTHSVGQSRTPSDSEHWCSFVNDTIRVWSHQLHALQQQFTERGGVILHGSACVESPYQVRVLEHSGQERKLQTAQLTIATGSNPVRPRFASGIAGQLNDAAYLLECQQLPRECCVIGASVTGLRAACVLAYWGSRVTVIDGLNFSETTQSDSSNSESRRWADWADELGVHFAWGLDVIGMASVNGRVKLTLETGRSVMTRFVWFATGRNGQTEDLGLENTALGIDDRYRLWCNQDGITWEPAIHAVGDVIAACRLTQDPVCS